MVKSNLAYKFEVFEEEIDYTYLPEKLKFTSVSLREIFNNKLRLEANSFNLETKISKEKIISNKYGFVNLWSKDGLIEQAFHRPRFKRIYVSHKEIPFYQPSSITDVYPKPAKYISAKTETDLESLRIKKGMLLMTVSGTIGKVSIAGKKIDGQIFSHDLLRLVGKDKYDTGYIYSYFQTKVGQDILQSNNYGAVIKHIEPEHLESVIIPNAPVSIKKYIHELIITSFDLRDDANDLIDKAEGILYQELKLKPIEDLKSNYFDNKSHLRNYTTKLSNLRFRLDCSYHIPVVQLVEEEIKKYSKEVTSIGNLSSNVILAGVFKRTYVDQENGVPFLGGRDITQLNP
ncbi:MAG: restriction endonuclease subunit S, partial [Flavobacterium sp.]